MILRPPSLRDRMILPEDVFDSRRHRAPGRRPLEFLLNPYRFGGGGPPVTERIYMDFEGANGSTTFTDVGTAASTWTAGGSAALTTAVVLAGTSSLSIPTTSSYISTPYNASNRVPPTGNWAITFQARSTGGWVQGGVGTVLLSCQDAGATAAGTAFVFATNSTGRILIIMSDGATRSVIVTGSTVLATSTTYTFEVTRTTNTITLRINGVSDGTGTFSGTVNTPVGQTWRIGQPAAGNNPPASVTFDTFRVS